MKNRNYIVPQLDVMSVIAGSILCMSGNSGITDMNREAEQDGDSLFG